MKKIAILIAGMLTWAPHVAFAAAVPNMLSGVIIFSCVTTDAGVKVDEEIYKIDFTKMRVNGRPVDFDISDLSLGWEYLPKRTDEQKRQRIDISGADGASINRYSGKLESGVQWNNSKRMTICRVAGHRKF